MTVDYTLVRMHFARGETHFIGVVVPGRGDAGEDLAHFGLVIDELQERLAPSTLATDPKHVFRGRVQVDYQQVVVEQYDAR